MKAVPSQTAGPERLPPFNLDEERLALATIFWGTREESAAMAGQLYTDYFYDISHQNLMLVMQAIAASGERIESMSVYRWITKHNQMEEVGGLPYISTLPEVATSAEQFWSALAELKSLALRRAILRDSSLLGEMVYDITVSDSALEDRMKRLSAAYVQSMLSDKSRYTSTSLCELPQAVDDDPSELIKHRFLSRGGGLLLTGPTGVGKSALTMQMVTSWGIGRDVFGITPARPLRSLVIQAENDMGDMRELRDGVFKGLEFTEEQQAQVGQNVHICTVDDICGVKFVHDVVNPLAVAFKPDIIWIDPLLAYLGGDVSSQETLSDWLRNTLNPVIHACDCACVLVHHTAKPPKGTEKGQWNGSDLAYLGLGSVELSNWPRAIIALRSIGSHDIYQLHLAKRGRRAGWKNPDGTPFYQKMIAHGDHGIFWREATEEQTERACKNKCQHTVEDILEQLDGETLSGAEWEVRCRKEAGISHATFFRLKKAAVSGKKIALSKIDKKWFKIE